METIKNLPLPVLIRYGLIGLVTVVLFALLPVAILQPSALKVMGSLGSVAGISLVAITAGFVLDGIKLYGSDQPACI